jgi:hypothetical protein
MTHTVLLRLADCSRRLRIPYQKLYFAVASGLVPAVRDATGSRWMVKESDLRLIAETLGLVQPVDAVA